MKDTLIDIFLTQAASTLELLDNKMSTTKARTRELADLEGAAELVGDPELERRVGLIAEAIRRGDAESGSQLADLVATLRPAPSTEARPPGEPTLATRAARAETGDSSPTGVHRPPRRRSKRFDTSEHLTLLNFFREESREGLDRIAGLLLEATSDKPDSEALNELMRLTHGLKGAAGTVDLPVVADLAHEYEDAIEKIHRNKMGWSLMLRDQLVEVADRLRLIIAEAADHEVSPESIHSLRRLLGKLDAPATDEEGDESPLLVTEGSNTETYAERRRPDRRGADTPVLRVDPSRIDRLMNSVGELVFDRTRIEKRIAELATELGGLEGALQSLSEQRASWVESGGPVRTDQLGSALSALESKLCDSLPAIRSAMERLQADATQLRRTEFSLQDGLTGVRMQSVRSIFQRLTPQLRAIARQGDKRVRLVTAGGETEFDKTVADQLVDPLIQLLRNAVAHGIESPEKREVRGKSPEGRINVTARHEGNVVVLEVSDDGNGIDTHELRQRLVKNGRWSESQATQARDERVMQMIFDDGVSARSHVNQLAGRGVGLSAVRETVTRLGGEILVSSLPNSGTTFTLRLPLTTAIANAMLFKIGGHVFAIPNVHVLDQDSIPLPLGESAHDTEGHSLPLVPLHELLGFPISDELDSCPVVLLEYLGKRLAISCDRIVGAREIVVKNLGPLLADSPLYAGGTISPSGKVQLILDPAALVRVAFPEDAKRALAARSDGVAMRVLVVDDSKAIRETMRHMLELAGYEVITASDGLQAWQTLLERGCDLLVTDLEMPGEGGFSLLQRLRGDSRYQTLPALVISSKATEENRRRADSLQVADFLAKPVQQQELVDALRAAQRSA